MYRNVRKRLEQCGTDIPEEGTVTLYHAGPVAKLIEIERALIIPAVDDDDARRRVYVAKHLPRSQRSSRTRMEPSR